MKIQVFILRHDAPYVSRLSHLNSLFNDKMFNVDIVNCSGLPLEDRILECLKRSWRRGTNQHTLIVTDRVITTHSNKSFYDILRRCLETEFDLAYLFKYNDKCQMHTEISQGATSIVSSHSPRGLEAILYSPSGRDIIIGKKCLDGGKKFKIKKNLEYSLNKYVYDGKINCIATSPNLFQYDISNCTHADQYQYRNECEYLQLQPKTPTQSNTRLIVILAFILVLIIVTAYALLQLGC